MWLIVLAACVALGQAKSIHEAEGHYVAKRFVATATQDGDFCAYNGQLYQQSEQWRDGCDLKCTCLCLQFQLPDVCHMDPAPAGKCCPVPNCPSYIHITYPSGYVPE